MLCYGSSSHFNTRDFEIRVVDAETSDPIAGMLMFLYWTIVPKAALDIKLSNQDDLREFYEQVKYWEAKEYLSDQDGWIRIKGWSKSLPTDHVVLDFGADPQFFLHKKGYGNFMFGNFVDRGDDFEEDGRYSIYKRKLKEHILGEEKTVHGLNNLDFWNGETIKLQKHGVDQGPTRVEDGSIYIFIRRVIYQQDIECLWEEIPNSMLALLEINLLSKEMMEYWIEAGAIEEKYLGMDPLEYSIRQSLGNEPCITFEEIREKYL